MKQLTLQVKVGAPLGLYELARHIHLPPSATNGEQLAGSNSINGS